MKKNFVTLCFAVAPALLILLSAKLHAAEIYKIVHSDGSVSYSDQPPLESEIDRVELPELFVTPAVLVPSRASFSSPDNNGSSSKTLRINSPLDEEVIRGSDNRLSITVSVSPEMSDTEKLQLFHNGSAYGQPQSSGSWNLARLNPGIQKFNVNLVDASGRIRAQSSTITVYVIL